MRHLPGRLSGILVIGAMLCCPFAASAGTITFGNMVATWSNVQGGSSVGYSGNGTSTAAITWGTPAGSGQSSYSFTGAGLLDVIVPPSPSPDFVIGTFTHANNPIAYATSIEGVRLTLETDVWLDGDLLGNYSFVYDFEHSETLNGNSVCANGGANGVGVNANGCADNVQTNHNSLSENFQVGSDLYTLEIRGFELFDGSEALSFWTKEGADSSAYLMARVAMTGTIPPTGPETGTEPEEEITTLKTPLIEPPTELEDGPTFQTFSETSRETSINAIPEPGSLALIVAGLVVTGMYRARVLRAGHRAPGGGSPVR